jgi:hypothetical protein
MGVLAEPVECGGDGGVEVSPGEGSSDGEGEVVEAANEEVEGGVEVALLDGVQVAGHAGPVSEHQRPQQFKEQDSRQGVPQQRRQTVYLGPDALLLLVRDVYHQLSHSKLLFGSIKHYHSWGREMSP